MQRLLHEFEQPEWEWEREEFAEQLVASVDPGIVSAMSVHLKSPDRSLRSSAAFVMAAKGYDQGFKVLIDEMNDLSEHPSRHGGIPSDGNQDNLRQRKQDRYFAVYLLRKLRDPRSVMPLLRHLDDPDIEYMVALALGQIGDQRAARPLRLKLRRVGTDNPTTRVFTAGGLAALGDAEGHAVLQEYMDGTDDTGDSWVYKRYAIELTALLKQLSYIERYLKLLQDPQPEIRIAAANALVELRAQRTIPAIGEQMGKEQRIVPVDQHNVYEALRQAILALRKQKI